ncbi:hypothetical protein PtB15_1B415 [Puccinia triticina]|nr:hypothetical protein PtB15_1B415 [Puccinia triticina]
MPPPRRNNSNCPVWPDCLADPALTFYQPLQSRFPPTRPTNWANPQGTANRYSKRTHAATQDPGKAAEAGQSGGSRLAAVDGRSSPAEAACRAQLLLPFNIRRLRQALQFVGPGSVFE